MAPPRRKTTQHLIPARRPAAPPTGRYDIYPAQPIASGRIEEGYASLLARMAPHRVVLVDGFVGVDWDEVADSLRREAQAQGIGLQIIRTADFLLPEADLDAMVEPFLGGGDPVFGRRCPLPLEAFFRPGGLRRAVDAATGPVVVVGTGAGLLDVSAFLVYIDIPKNEIQFRSRAGTVCSLGKRAPHPAAQYKRFYFVDWPVLNREKARLLPRIDAFVDGQRHGDPRIIDGALLRGEIARMARGPFRARPWFEPGPWGGQWIRERVDGLSGDVPNYAWSFELISPENGMLLEHEGVMLEFPFDLLMFQEHLAILGDCAEAFGYEFPIRFDFLDTFAGGNLSVQCHPRPEYIRREFGETFTQDETYYILDCKPGAEVYLGFREDIKPAEFRVALEGSIATGAPVNIDDFVLRHAARKHDLFLIPNGTVHCSGIDSLVLEISATPYIFTFKMYDWMRLDLNGQPRPLNVARAFDNLYFDRRGESARRELISRPAVIKSGEGWRVVHLPTHAHHFYDVHRYEFGNAIDVETLNSAIVLSLVEGDTVRVECAGAGSREYAYAETFVIPAAADAFRLVSPSGRPLMVVAASMKPRAACVAGSWPGDDA